MKRTISTLTRLWVVLLLVLGVAVGCGSDTDEATEAADTGEQAAAPETGGSDEADADDDAGEDPAAAFVRLDHCGPRHCGTGRRQWY